MAKDKKSCSREKHFTLTFIGFSVGLMLMAICASLVQSSREDDAKSERAKKERCADLEQVERKYTKLYYGLYSPSQKHTHNELKDALAELLVDRAWEFEGRRTELNCGAVTE